MVFCYTATNKTKIFADILGKILDRPIYMLESELDPSSKVSFAVSAIFKNSIPVTNIPYTVDDEEIYICGPVWRGRPAGTIRYFLENAPIKGKKVNMLLTAAVSHMKYCDKGINMIESAGCIPGTVEVFASQAKSETEPEIIEAHIRELFT